MKDIDELLKSLSFYNKLNNDEIEALKKSLFCRKYDKNQFLRSHGDECLGYIKVISGSIRVYMLSDEGREITLFRLFEGDECILSASCVIEQIDFDIQLTSEEKTEIFIINSGIFEKLTEKNIYVKCYMYESLAGSFSKVMNVMQNILFLGLDKRLAKYLVSECERTGKNVLKTTHEQVAKELGSAREVVARKLKQFSENNIVEVKRGLIAVNDIKALRDISD